MFKGVVIKTPDSSCAGSEHITLVLIFFYEEKKGQKVRVKNYSTIIAKSFSLRVILHI
jgi:hypothetical protein